MLNLAMMGINCADMLGPIDHGGKGFKATFSFVLGGNMAPSTWTMSSSVGEAQSCLSGGLKFSSDSISPTASGSCSQFVDSLLSISY